MIKQFKIIKVFSLMMTYYCVNMENILMENLVNNAKMIVLNVLKIKNAINVKNLKSHFLEFVQD